MNPTTLDGRTSNRGRAKLISVSRNNPSLGY